MHGQNKPRRRRSCVFQKDKHCKVGHSQYTVPLRFTSMKHCVEMPFLPPAKHPLPLCYCIQKGDDINHPLFHYALFYGSTTWAWALPALAPATHRTTV